MLSVIRNVLVAAAIGLASSPLFAGNETVTCRFPEGETASGTLPEDLQFVVNDANGRAQWTRPNAVDAKGDRITGIVTKNSDSRMELRFSPVAVRDRSGQYANLTFNFVYVRSSGMTKVYVIVSGFANRFTGKGVCKSDGRSTAVYSGAPGGSSGSGSKPGFSF